jgi:hypothetical protein
MGERKGEGQSGPRPRSVHSRTRTTRGGTPSPLRIRCSRSISCTRDVHCLPNPVSLRAKRVAGAANFSVRDVRGSPPGPVPKMPQSETGASGARRTVIPHEAFSRKGLRRSGYVSHAKAEAAKNATDAKHGRDEPERQQPPPPEDFLRVLGPPYGGARGPPSHILRGPARPRVRSGPS